MNFFLSFSHVYNFIRFDSIYIVNMMMIWLIELRLYSIRWFVIVLILAMEKKWNDFFCFFFTTKKMKKKWYKWTLVWCGPRKKTTIIFHNHSSIQKRMNEWMLWSMKWNHHIFEKRSIINWPSLRPSSCVCVCVCANIARWSSEKLYIDRQINYLNGSLKCEVKKMKFKIIKRIQFSKNKKKITRKKCKISLNEFVTLFRCCCCCWFNLNFVYIMHMVFLNKQTKKNVLIFTIIFVFTLVSFWSFWLSLLLLLLLYTYNDNKITWIFFFFRN